VSQVTFAARFLLDASGHGEEDGYRTGRLSPQTSRIAHADRSALDPSVTDGKVWERLRTSDVTVIDEIVHAHLALLLRVARRYGVDAATGEDVVQDVFVRLWERREILQVRTTVRAYLVAMVRNAVVSRFRHARIELDAAAILGRAGESPTAAVMIAPDRAIEDAELSAALREALDTLPPRMRQVAWLRWQDGLSRQEIAVVLGTSEATVRNQLHTLVRHLRARLANFF
jgi:RNA polymerase sigma factor (sigma-70 family)